MNLIEEIANTWSIEAKKEDSQRYFFHTKEVSKIEEGKKSLVIGRKGSGKTAIGTYLEQKKEFNAFSVKLSFKNFPFQEVYKLDDQGFSTPYQYITLWKYVIYSHIARLMMQNENIDLELRNKLQEIYGDDSERLSIKIKKWTGVGFKFFGIGGDVKFNLEDNNISWQDKVNILENIIKKNIDSAKYFIIFDELDEDYKNIVAHKLNGNYLSLLTSLFKAVEDVKSYFKSIPTILPVVFLRDDIYEILTANDKNKWKEEIIFIDWNINSIKKLLAFRISRTMDEDRESILDFNVAWHQVFENQDVVYGNSNSKKSAIIDYIALGTHMRPRDFIEYIKTCAESLAETNHKKINSNTVKRNEEAFSNYLKRELEDEIYAILPNIHKIFSILAQFHRQTFKINDIKDFYQNNSTYPELEKIEQNIEFVLTVLFHFSVIGNHPDPNTRRFKYENKEATIEFGKSLCFHRGLFKSLKIN